MNEHTQEEMLKHWFPEHPAAIALCESLAIISQVWDDLIDGDNPVSPAETSEMVMQALFGVRRNAFFREHEDRLDWALERACRDWFESNALEAEGKLRHVTYSLRSAITPIIIDMAYIVHGTNGHAYAIQIREFLFNQDESYEEYEIEQLALQAPLRLVEDASDVHEEA